MYKRLACIVLASDGNCAGDEGRLVGKLGDLELALQRQ